jgi:hypothetical protein
MQFAHIGGAPAVILIPCVGSLLVPKTLVENDGNEIKVPEAIAAIIIMNVKDWIRCLYMFL